MCTLAALVLMLALPGVSPGATLVPPETPLLSGPVVNAPAQRMTLVERNFDGHLIRLEDEPETAAVLKLALAEDQRASVNKLIADRTAALDKLVTTHYTLIVDAGAALQKFAQATLEERKSLLRTYAALQTAMEPWRDRGTLLDEAKSVLRPEQEAAARSLADEYRAALAKEVAKDAKPNSTPLQMQIRANLEEFGRLVKQSIQRRADFANAQLADLISQLDLTPEQGEKVRVLFMEYAVGVIQGTRDRTMSARERKQIMVGLTAILTPEQRTKLGELMLDGKVKAKKPDDQPPM